MNAARRAGAVPVFRCFPRIVTFFQGNSDAFDRLRCSYLGTGNPNTNPRLCADGWRRTMIRVSHVSTKRSTAWIPIVVSVLLHLGFYSQADGLGQIVPKPTVPVGWSSARLPTAAQARTGGSPQTRTETGTQAETEAAPHHAAGTCFQSGNAPTQRTPRRPPPKAVFGVTAESVAEGQSGVSVRRGATPWPRIWRRITPSPPRWEPFPQGKKA